MAATFGQEVSNRNDPHSATCRRDQASEDRTGGLDHTKPANRRDYDHARREALFNSSLEDLRRVIAIVVPVCEFQVEENDVLVAGRSVPSTHSPPHFNATFKTNKSKSCGQNPLGQSVRR